MSEDTRLLEVDTKLKTFVTLSETKWREESILCKHAFNK